MLRQPWQRAAAGAAAALLVAAALAAGVWMWRLQAQLRVVSSARECVPPAEQVASLFTDDQWTVIRIGSPDLSKLRVLRAEPANTLPGMFGSLLALSPDAARLAYVTASDEMMDDAHIYFLDVADPAERHGLADVAEGLEPVRPAWSPDGRQLAYVVGRGGGDQATTFEVWTANSDGTTPPVRRAELPTDTFSRGHTVALCWTRTGSIGLLPGAESAQRPSTPSPAPSAPAGATPTAGGVQGGGSTCTLPVLSQNDPGWRHLIMQAGGDPIGGYGCALTSTAMVLDHYGASLTPAQLSACLGPGADPILWSQAPACAVGASISGGTRLDFSWEALDSVLGSGRPAIVGMVRGPTGMHFVVVTAGGGGLAEAYRITDPWDGSTTKTLGSYTNAGYNPRWIITYEGTAERCGRLLPGPKPPVTGVQDGGSYEGPVSLGKAISGLISVIKIWPLQGGTGPEPSPSPQWKVPKIWNLGDRLELSDEGIYQVVAKTAGRTLLLKFTIDRTPPAPMLSLLNPLSGGVISRGVPYPSPSGSAGLSLGSRQVAASVPAGADTGLPVLARPGKLRIDAQDQLSGVERVEYILDGGLPAAYSDDVSFHRTLLVPAPGKHSIRFRAVDLAGNVSEMGEVAFVVEGPVPTPTPTPRTTAQPTPTATPTPTPIPWVWSLSPTQLTFVPGGPLSQSITLSVGGQIPVTLARITLSSQSNNFAQQTTCRVNAPLPPGSSCSITVTFRPSGGSVPPTGSITVTDARGAWQVVALKGFLG